MKYLKPIFEDINKDGWEEIPRQLFNDIIGFSGSADDSSVKDISIEKMLKLKSLYLGVFEREGHKSPLRQNIHTPNYLYELVRNKKFIHISATTEHDIDLYIFELEDDWYLVYKKGGWNSIPVFDTCYKCDQFDGLINLLDNHLLRRYKPTTKKPFFKRVKNFLGMNENINDTLFTVIDKSEYDSKTHDSVTYTKSEISFISDSLKEINRKYSVELRCQCQGSILSANNISKDRKNIDTLDIVYLDPTQQMTFLISFTKGYDKWFYSFDWMRYCKCDDLEGIVSCIDERVDRLIPHLARAREIHNFRGFK